MKKVVTYLFAVVGLCAIALAGAAFWLRAHVLGELQAGFDDFNRQGIEAKYASADFDPLSRTLRVEGISFARTASGYESKLTRLVAERGWPLRDGLSFEKVELMGLDSSARMAGSTTRQKAAYSVMTGVAFRKAQAAGRPGAPMAHALSHLFADRIEIKEVTAEGTAADPLTGDLIKSTMTYADIVMSGIAAGVVGQAKCAHSTGMVEAPGIPMQVTIEDTVSTAYDMPAAMAAMEGAPGPGMTRFFATAGAGKLTTNQPGKVQVSVGSLLVEDGRADMQQAAKHYSKLVETKPKYKTARPEQMRPFAEAMAQLYQSVAVGKMSFKNIKVSLNGGPEVAFDEFRFAGLLDGKLQEVLVAGLDVPAPTGNLKIGSFAIQDFDISKLMRLSGQAGAVAPPAPIEVFKLVGGFKGYGMELPHPASGETIALDVLEFAWGNFVGDIPARGSFLVKGKTPAAVIPPDQAAALGLTAGSEVAFATDGRWSWDEASKTVMLGPASIDMPGFYSASASLKLSEVGREVLMAKPEAMGKAFERTSFDRLEVALEDKGLLAVVAREPGFPKDEQAIASETRKGFGALAMHPVVEAVSSASARFLMTPNGRLTFSVTPVAKLELGDLGRAITAAANALHAPEAGTPGLAAPAPVMPVPNVLDLLSVDVRAEAAK